MKPKFGLIVNTSSDRAEEIIRAYASYHGVNPDSKPLLKVADELGIKFTAGEIDKRERPFMTGIIGKGEIVKEVLDKLGFGVEGRLEKDKRYAVDFVNGTVREV